MGSFEDFPLAKTGSGSSNVTTARLFADAYTPQPIKETSPSTVHHHFWDGALTIASDVGAGALDELEHHPWKLLADFGIGAATAAAVIALGPEALSGVGVAGAIGAATSLIGMRKDVSAWLHDAKVVLNQDGYSEAQVAQANQGLKGMGGGFADAAAGFVGGAAASGVMAHLPVFNSESNSANGAISGKLGDDFAAQASLFTRRYPILPKTHLPFSTVYGASRRFLLPAK